MTILALLPPLQAKGAPSAALVMDARTGEVLHASNADTRLHPASLTKMMTLYITFEAIKKGEISLDTQVTISSKAANEPPSKLGMRPGQKIALRYLIRAAAVKSANDAATAIGEAIAGSEAAFARRMNRTAAALGMTRSTFKNANGLTETGHLSTARDMTILGRHLFYDYPEYYNLFSRMTADVGGRQVANTNSRFLSQYKGADGIKTGFTNAAGFNLTASAERGSERIITTVFGGVSTAARNAKVAELMDLGFRRAPSNAKTKKPGLPNYSNLPDEPLLLAGSDQGIGQSIAAGKTIRLITTISKSIVPMARPNPAAPEPLPEELLLALASDVSSAVSQAQAELATATPQDTGPGAEAEALVAAAGEDDGDLTPAAETETAQVAAAGLQLVAPVLRPVLTEAAVAEATGLSGETAPAAAPAQEADSLVLAALGPVSDQLVQPLTEGQPEIVTRISTSGGRYWGINVGTYSTRDAAERMLLRTALNEIGTLDEALRKVNSGNRGFEANFVGMSEELAGLACRRLTARGVECSTFGPG